jgi:hypothetical protein
MCQALRVFEALSCDGTGTSIQGKSLLSRSPKVERIDSKVHPAIPPPSPGIRGIGAFFVGASAAMERHSQRARKPRRALIRWGEEGKRQELDRQAYWHEMPERDSDLTKGKLCRKRQPPWASVNEEGRGSRRAPLFDAL